MIYIFKSFFSSINKIRLVSSPIKKMDGYYFDVKVPSIIEPINISASELHQKHCQQLSKNDQETVAKYSAYQVKYQLICIQVDDFLILNIKTGERSWMPLELKSLKSIEERTMTDKELIQITHAIEKSVQSKNNAKVLDYMQYELSSQTKTSCQILRFGE